ncbi:DNA sulfur modification protein DndD [Methylotetracoccus oryzae]|uniref:DNA sulfur modification protein DndD n=1 Tax=Methylotetracoccus oryzae TaxID=1919059 RepID=UPI00111B580A|nr:DNA sulfur modification protein DndD [Methylotetracoccus oryzae]
MILDTIILENFGAYGGRQEAELTPEAGKPIILFGGLNGGGKTTLLDAIQLAFYGPKARLSNRGRRAYKDYLRESIHRGSDPGEGASVVVRFRRMIEGETRYFELSRSWRQGVKGIEETVRVLRDGRLDDVFTDHWDEVIEAYLPSGIAHLFFFDGEQIMELAEGGHAAEILGTAVHSLLGLDLVERLDTDLKVFERRKRTEALDAAATEQLTQLRGAIEKLDQEQEQLANEEGALVNQAGRLAKEVLTREETFRTEGGELFLQRTDLEKELVELQRQRAHLEGEFRELVAGPLPLLMLDSLLVKAEKQVRHEREIRHAHALVEALEERDNEVLAMMESRAIDADVSSTLSELFSADRERRRGIAQEPLLLDTSDELAPRIAHLRSVVLPEAQDQVSRFVERITALSESIARVEGDLARVPDSDRMTIVQAELELARRAHAKKLAELEALRAKIDMLRRQRAEAETRLDKIGELEGDARLAEDDRQRMLKHSQKARDTLQRLRTRVVQRHTRKMESLMLESFQQLLHKSGLVSDLRINPATFEATLIGRDGQTLPFDRLSAGERQLLATSMLWGLARASGRPVPTVIDTPLGRLDSEHRSNLVNRYFPNASHQVLLLSTDEELIGPCLDDLSPYIARSYLLANDQKAGTTQIQPGYFAQ